MNTRLTDYILNKKERTGFVVGSLPILREMGRNVSELSQDPLIQRDAILKFNERFDQPVITTAMDLSIEAEAFTAQVAFTDDHPPHITQSPTPDRTAYNSLFAPKVGHRRTGIPLGVVQMLKEHYGEREDKFILGSMIGPFSLACLLNGMDKAFLTLMEEPEFMHDILKRATDFLRRYAETFLMVGADGVFMCDPTAGLISEDSMREFALPYQQEIIRAVQTPEFAVIYHNCGAKQRHVPIMVESGAAMLHFGRNIDMIQALKQVPSHLVLAGNLDPAAVFNESTPEMVKQATTSLLDETKGYKNFSLSSGCDLPLSSPLENIEAFFEGLNSFNS